MAHPLELKLVRLRRRLRWWMVAHGVSRLIAAAVGTVVVLGLIDYLLRFEDRGIRVMLTAALLGVVGWACHRWLYRPATTRLAPLDLARRVGRRFPELGDDLPSAIEFLKQPEDNPVAGSPKLRRTVIAAAAANAERVDFMSMLDRRPVARGVLVAVGVCLAAGILLLADTLSCQIAMTRLAYPLGEVAWPRKNHLQLVERVTRVARGQPFEIEVVDADGARLPSRVAIHYRSDGPQGESTEEIQPMRLVGTTMVARRENVTRPFAYRVEGGDDRRMGWIDVEVVEPPAVASLAATIRPPAYTGRPPIASTGELRVLRGSRVEIDALATKPLKSASLVLENDGAIACRIHEDGRRFAVVENGRPGFVPKESGFYRFDLVDREGIHSAGAERWEIHVLDDRPPTVSIERPSATTFVAPGATLPVRVTANDDLGARRIDLVVEPTEDAEITADRQGQDVRRARTIVLFEGPPRAEANDGSGGQRRTVDYQWDLASLSLEPGRRFSFHALAEDYLPQSGKSDSRAVVVVRPEELIDRLAQRQESILAELARARTLQKESRRQLDQPAGAPTDRRELDQASLDRLRGAELSQREVHRILTSRDDGVPGKIEHLLDELANNRIDSPEVGRRMENLLAELDRLGRDVLPRIAHEMTTAIKTSEARLETETPANAPASAAVVDASLAAARAGQDEVFAVLNRLLGRLNQWKDYRRFHQQWAELLLRQESLAERTESLGRDLLGKRPEDVSPETAARLDAAGNDQLELARQLEVLAQEMDEARVNLAERDPLAAKTVADAIARSRELGISSRMRAAGESIGRNRLGQAQASQTKVIDDLREVLALLAGRREDELARLAEKLPETEGLLSALIRRQTSLCERMEHEAAKPAQGENALAEWRSLGRRQAQLQAEAVQLAALLNQLLARQPAESVDEAAGHMRRASRSAESGLDKPAVEAARQALASLDEAARRLADHLQQVRADAAAEQLARLESAIRSIETRQRETLDATKRLDAEPRAADDGSRRATVLRRLAGRQRSIETATSQLAATLAHAPIFQKVLDESAGQMAVAAGWLGRQACDARVQTAQEAALNGLTRLIASLRPSTANAQAPAPGGAQGAAENRPPGTQAAPGAVAQLRLLKMLQEDLFTRTQQWELRYGGQTPLSPEAEREYKRLSEEQGQVADLLFDLIEDEAKDRTPPKNAPAEEAK